MLFQDAAELLVTWFTHYSTVASLYWVGINTNTQTHLQTWVSCFAGASHLNLHMKRMGGTWCVHIIKYKWCVHIIKYKSSDVKINSYFLFLPHLTLIFSIIDSIIQRMGKQLTSTGCSWVIGCGSEGSHFLPRNHITDIYMYVSTISRNISIEIQWRKLGKNNGSFYKNMAEIEMFTVRTSAIISNRETNDILHSVLEKSDNEYFKSEVMYRRNQNTITTKVVFRLVLVIYLQNTALIISHAGKPKMWLF
jgi:hypothetical protein